MNAAKVGLIIATLFLARDLTHREHLSTRSYATHGALTTFYDGIVPLADQLAECCMGRYGARLEIPLVTGETGGDIADVLRSQLEWIHGVRYEAIPKDESALQNIIDEVEGLFMATLYRLTLQ